MAQERGCPLLPILLATCAAALPAACVEPAPDDADSGGLPEVDASSGAPPEPDAGSGGPPKVDGGSGDLTVEAAPSPNNPVIALLEAGEAVFGVFSGERTPERAAIVAENTLTDFVFYSLESGPFDVATMEAYMDGMRDEEGAISHPLVLRIPPIDDEARAADQVAQALAAGVGGIVIPHVARPEQAAAAVRVIPGLWPADPNGRVVGFLIVEDRQGVANVDEIVAVEGPTVVFAGPGDLRRAYEGDMDAVEAAIQRVLAACREHDVPCGITAGTDDVADRLEQGFRVIIVTEEEALAVGRAAAGRD